MALPEELVFTVDDRVRRDIKHAKQQYLETVRHEHAPSFYPNIHHMFLTHTHTHTHTLHPPACVFLLSQAAQLQVVCCAFTSFGKAAIKQRKVHPDTFVQLALQLAYYKLHGRYS